MSSATVHPEAHSSPPVANLCSALDPSARWDDPKTLRGDILLAEELVAHAADLARAHGEPSKRVAQGGLWQRFVAVEGQIHDAYAVLTERLRSGQDPTPAEEWLLENSHVVEDQIREIREDLPRGYRKELPRIATGAMSGHPRVYALCLDYLRHTDARLDLTTLAEYVQSYQSVKSLTIGELWAVPIMLRLGLLLSVGSLAASEASAGNRQRADAWAEKIFAAHESPHELGAVLVALEKRSNEITAPFLVQLARRLRESEDTALGVAFDWLGMQAQKLEASLDELSRLQHLRQAADQVSVGNAITSMRAVAALDWNGFFERTSGVEALLRRDPLGTYGATAPVTRDRFRHAVEHIARRAIGDELDVARAALGLAVASHERNPHDPKRAHVGYYLVDDGRATLEQRVGYRAPLGRKLRRAALAYPNFAYFGALSVLTLAVVALAVFAAWQIVGDSASAPAMLVLVGLLALLPASEVALSLTQALVTALLEPHLLPRLDFEKGVPPEHRTLVVVPCLLDSQETVATLLADLEIRSLANGDRHLHFALLSDFTDAPQEEVATDAALLRAAVEGISQLNERHSDGASSRFWLLHRRRLHNPSEDCYMGWDRKRGKLEELNRLLRGATDTTFSCVDAPSELFPSIRYVITLDADTELPRDTARNLIATIAHPLSAPEFDTTRQRVVRGYGIVQPRVGALPSSSRQSRYAALNAGPPGIDPYTTAVSDVYQDLFAEGSYTGKAIYDVDAFAAALAGRSPENALLSHDLFESFFARSALATDVELLDEQPSSYEVDAARRHRWIRGDWQLLPWLLPNVPAAKGKRRNDLRLLDRWKLLDNLRRSLLAPALVVMLVAGWFNGVLYAALATLVFSASLAAPLVAQAVLGLTREASRVSGTSFAGLGGALARGALNVLTDAALLLDQALVSLDAIGVALFRLASRKRLLQWVTMRATAKGSRDGVSPRLLVGSVVSFLLAVALLTVARDAAAFALPLLTAWALAPLLVGWLSAPLPERRAEELSPEDERTFRHLARKTWRFFELFVTAADHHLPPDNYQSEPRAVLAHRTSPTNIGLYLMSALAAHDFGIVTLSEYTRRLRLTLDTLDRLPHRDGHLLNWYDTRTLAPLPPEYVSTVDSGNLAAYLWTIASAHAELASGTLTCGSACRAVADALELAIANAEGEAAGRIEKAIAAVAAELVERSKTGTQDLQQSVETLGWAAAQVHELVRLGENLPPEAGYWLGEAERTARTWREELTTLAPHLLLLAETAPVLDVHAGEAWAELRSELARPRSLQDLRDVSKRAAELLDEMVDLGERAVPGAGGGNSRVIEGYRLAIDQGLERCQAMLAMLDELATRCRGMADGMSFQFLFDPSRELFSTGYNVSNARLDTSHYDLLASEARLASLVAIAKGDAPQKHWFRLARPRTRIGSQGALLSWSGSMFEYLMPLLVTNCAPRSLIDEAMRGAVNRQRSYGAEQRVPWGISESAYNVMDLEMTYQYRAFGVPGLGLKAGLGEDLVVAPYATALASLVDPVAAAKNLRTLGREGLEGQFGYYEAIDYTPTRLPPGKRGVVVRSFMAHHLGMTLVALDNVLNSRCMQRRFHADPRIKASELLLEERIPTDAPMLEVPEAALAAPVRHALDLDASEHVKLEEGTPPRVHLLGHGALSTLVTTTGTGALTWQGVDINRFREDTVFEAGGIYAYVRHLGKRRLWSAGFLPTRRVPEQYDAAFFVDRVELRRRDSAIETITEIVPSAEHPAEVRRYTLKNHGDLACEIELTTFTELALAPRSADVAHRAFSSMFIETEALPEQGAVIAHRRPRSTGERALWVAQVLTPESEDVWPFDYDTSRAEFVGRDGSLERPAALEEGHALARRTGAVLDAAFVLQRRVRLDRGATVRLSLATLMAETREELLHLVATYAAPQAIPRAFELALADARVELRHLGLTAVQAHRYQRLLSAIIFPQLGLRSPIDPMAVGSGGKTALWARGISGDMPIVVLRIDHLEFDDILRELLLAHEYFRINGVMLDLVLLNEEPSGYLQPLQEHALDVVRSTHSEGHMNQAGGIFLCRTDQISEGDRQLLLAAARVVLSASGGSLSRQLKRAVRRTVLPELLRPSVRPALRPSIPPPAPGELLFYNGIGGFTPDGREYVMTVGRHHRTPLPWCNVIANPAFGCVVSESGSLFTWAGNSQRHRLTPWSNDPLLDPSGEAIYVRDDDDSTMWSPTPRPCGGSATYKVAHGQGYTTFSHMQHDLQQEFTVFASATEALRFQRLRIENRGSTTRQLSVFGVVEWVLGSSRETSRLSVLSAWDVSARALLASNPFAQVPQGTAFFSATAPVKSYSADREEFFGASGSRRWPQALLRVALSGQVGSGLDPCAALHTSFTLAAGECLEVSFVLGWGRGRDEARALATSFADNEAVGRAFAETRKHWDQLLSVVTVKTPDPSIDVMVNRWMLYQAASCRIWARSGFYQSSGAYGFRDQLQDVLSLLHALPSAAREHLLRAAARQFVEGDVQHWWHPEAGDGVRTHCSDDRIWLPYAVAEYLKVTQDLAVLEEAVPFLSERRVESEEHDLYSTPPNTAETASLYEHCARALDSSLAVGPHGLPKIGAGDWNDGMNRVGVRGDGESVWLAWFLAKTLIDFAPTAAARGDQTRSSRWLVHARQISDAAEQHGWDGAWYRRAYFDDGTPLGSSTSPECRIDAIAQSWAVLAGTADGRRAARAVLESERQLVREDAKIMQLLTPPFTGQSQGPDPGYIASYPAGVRENGGQYTHGILFTLRALAELGESSRLERLVRLVNPIHHALTPAEVERYKVEPYVVAADIYSASGHEGRGGWTWYTGSASWFYRILVEDVLGFRRIGNEVTISPCIPATWPRFELTYRYGRSTLHIVVDNTQPLTQRGTTLDGRALTGSSIPLVDDGGTHELRWFGGEGPVRSSHPGGAPDESESTTGRKRLAVPAARGPQLRDQPK